MTLDGVGSLLWGKLGGSFTKALATYSATRVVRDFRTTDPIAARRHRAKAPTNSSVAIAALILCDINSHLRKVLVWLQDKHTYLCTAFYLTFQNCHRKYSFVLRTRTNIPRILSVITTKLHDKNVPHGSEFSNEVTPALRKHQQAETHTSSLLRQWPMQRAWVCAKARDMTPQ